MRYTVDLKGFEAGHRLKRYDNPIVFGLKGDKDHLVSVLSTDLVVGLLEGLF